MSSTVKNILEIRKQYEKSKQVRKELESMEKTIKDFQDMIDKGLVQPRGYTLKTVDEECFTCSFNNMS